MQTYTHTKLIKLKTNSITQFQKEVAGFTHFEELLIAFT